MFNLSLLKKEIYIAIIVTAIVMFFIEPALKFAGHSVVWAGANIYEGVSNSIYKDAALGLREKFSFITLTFLISLFAGIISGVSLVLLKLSLSNRRSRIKSKEARTKRLKYFAFVLSFLFVIDSLLLTGKSFATLQLNASFNQRITVLSASVSDQQIKELRANWALMKNRSDYLKINLQMGQLATAAKIELPTPLWD